MSRICNLFFYPGGNNREAELMASLQLLIDRLNSGDLPISQSVWEQIQKGGAVPEGGSVTNINRLPGGHGKQVNLIRLIRDRKYCILYFFIQLHLYKVVFHF